MQQGSTLKKCWMIGFVEWNGGFGKKITFRLTPKRFLFGAAISGRFFGLSVHRQKSHEGIFDHSELNENEKHKRRFASSPRLANSNGRQRRNLLAMAEKRLV